MAEVGRRDKIMNRTREGYPLTTHPSALVITWRTLTYNLLGACPAVDASDNLPSIVVTVVVACCLPLGAKSEQVVQSVHVPLIFIGGG